MTSWLFLGAGYSARALARHLAGTGARFTGTTRAPDKAERLKATGIAPILVTGGSRDALGKAVRQATHLLVSAAPGEAGDPFLPLVRDVMAAGPSRPQWIGYLSTTGIYGDHGGGWVDEETAPAPRSAHSQARLAAEKGWQALGEETGIPVAILRLTGIYGPGRNPLASLVGGRANRIVKPGQVFNRIHVADIAGTAAHLGAGRIAGIFNVTDDLPSPATEPVEHAARLMGVAPPPETAYDPAAMSPMARAFYEENRRVSNARLKGAGYALRFPDYRRGLDAMWRDGTWKSEDAS
jgi:nucleoside-diphosphate-sugar epimerase